MKQLVGQLRQWRFRERLVRLAWGGSGWVAIVATVLAAACLADWVYDRSADVPLVLRVMATIAQVALAVGLGYPLLLRAWARAPRLDRLAYMAEQAIPEFDHRLVTALQLNRPGADTRGMSKTLLAEVTREAGEMAARHRLTRLVNYRPATRGLMIVAPALLGWAAFFLYNPALAAILLQRQALLGGEIPRSVQLTNITQDVWPSGAEVILKYRVTGEFTEEMTGTAYVHPDGQPTDEYQLRFDEKADDGSAVFVAKLPPSSTPFEFRGRLRDGRTRTSSRVTFEPPPQVLEIEALQLLPGYLGLNPSGGRYQRTYPRGEVINALPESEIQVGATFNKPVTVATLIPIERGQGNKEADRPPAKLIQLADEGKYAEWRFPITAKTIGYRIELTDARGFTSPAPARRGVRVWPDEPPTVEFRRESTRNPDPTDFYAQGSPDLYVWEIPVAWQPTGAPGEGDSGPIQVIYAAKSELGIGRVNLAYRVIPKGEQAENLHPRDDPAERVFKRLPLTPYTADLAKVGKWVPDLGLFEWSYVRQMGPPRTYLFPPEQLRVQVELYKLPSPNPATSPGDLEAGGRYNFQTNGLKKPISEGQLAKLEVGDTVELYVEVFDKYSEYLEGKKLPGRPAGYTREARRKTIVSEEEAGKLYEAHKRLQDRLRSITDDQRGIFQPKSP